MYLLDTNVFIEFADKTSPSVVSRILAESPTRLFLSSISRAELMFGAYNSQRIEENIAWYYELFAQFESVAFDDSCAEEYGKARAFLRRRGMQIGANDLLIAAIALTHNLTLITANTREFERIPRLRIENWEV